MSDTSVDPFTQGGQAVFEALIAFPQFADEVRVGNRISASRRPGIPQLNKPTGGPADYLGVGTLQNGAELRVSQGGFLLAPFGSNSRISEARQVYTVALAIDVLDVTRINRLKWFGLRALLRAGSELGLPFVRTWTISDAAEQPTHTVGETQQNGWSTAFAVNVEMYWQRSTL